MTHRTSGRWFGESWDAPICDPELHIETPVGMVCIGHEHMHERSWDVRGNRPRSEVVEEWDQGVTMPGPDGERVAYHLDCWLHEIGVDRIVGIERTK